MRRFIVMLMPAVLCTVLCLCAGFALAAEQEIARVIAFSPDASAKGPAGSRALALKAPLYAQDEIITGPNGMVQLIFNDETTMTLSADASAAMADFAFDEAGAGKPSFSMNLGKGMARMVTGEIVKRNPDGFAVTTPHGTIGIRGTGFSLHVDAHRTLLLSFQMTPGHGILAINNATGERTMLNSTDMVVELRPEGTVKRPATPEELNNMQFSARPAVPNTPTGQNGQGGGAAPQKQGGLMAQGNGQSLLPQDQGLSDALREQQLNPQTTSAELAVETTVTPGIKAGDFSGFDANQVSYNGTLYFTTNLNGMISDGHFGASGRPSTNTTITISGANGAGTLTNTNFQVDNFAVTTETVTDGYSYGVISGGSASFAGTVSDQAGTHITSGAIQGILPNNNQVNITIGGPGQ